MTVSLATWYVIFVILVTLYLEVETMNAYMMFEACTPLLMIVHRLDKLCFVIYVKSY